MVRRDFFSIKWTILAAAFAGLALLGFLAILNIGHTLPPGSTNLGGFQGASGSPSVEARQNKPDNTPAFTATASPVVTQVPTEFSTPSATGTATVPASATPVATATEVASTLTPAPTKTIPPPSKSKGGTPTLPNGVRYGDHTPNLPGRIVRITSPNVKLDSRVYEVYGTSQGLWEVADYAAGHNYNSSNPGEGGNIVLSGHNNYRGEVFRYLEFLKPGDTITVWTLEGKRFDYKVEQIEKLREAGASMAQRLQNGKVMDPTPDEQLTLVTCWPYTTYTHRLIVIAKPVK